MKCIHQDKLEYCYGIDKMKFWASLLVVCMHTYFLWDLNTTAYTLFQYVSDFAVPFFFITSGFFWGRNLNFEPECIKDKTQRYFKRLIRPFLIWGGIYTILEFVHDVFIEKKTITYSVVSRIGHILTDGPGGALWYVLTVLWCLVVINLFVSSRKKLIFVFIIFLILYLFNVIWGDIYFAETMLGKVHDAFYFIVPSERIFIFRGVFFFLGAIISLIESRIVFNEKFLCILQILSYIVWCICGESNYWIVRCLIYELIRLWISILYFLIGYNMQVNSSLLKRKGASMATIIYFSHSSLIFAVEFIFYLLGANINNYWTCVAVFCCVVLSVFSYIISDNPVTKRLF